MNSIQVVLAIASSHCSEVHEMDVKSAFLHGDLQEEIYMEQPQGFIKDPTLVCHLRKSLYGLKQAPWAWYAKMDSFLLSVGFTWCHSNPYVYILQQGDSLLFLVLYVDDLLITGSSSPTIKVVKVSLRKVSWWLTWACCITFLGLRSFSLLLVWL